MSPALTIGAVRVFTADIDAARDFYDKKLGLPLLHHDDETAIFDTGQAKLIVEAADPSTGEEAELIGRFTGFSFTVDSVAACFSDLRLKGVTFDGFPETQEWGGALAFFFDPDGNVLTLVEYPKD
ncbi:MAG: VOC family protein [Alphaproteobacteria bacterium]